MKVGFASSAAVLSVLALLAWIASLKPPAPSPVAPHPAAPEVPGLEDRTGGSLVPCAVPLAWRLARIDDQFGLSPEQATAALARAAALWEDARGRKLFVHDPTGGLPIRFVYDERQARTGERVRLLAGYEAEGDTLDARVADLRALLEEYEAAEAAYDERMNSFQERSFRYNTRVRTINDLGGAAQANVPGLQAAAQALEVEKQSLAERRRELGEMELRYRREEERLNEELRAHNERADALERAFPPSRVESGVYREAVQTHEDRTVTVSREIRVYRFDDENDLLRIAAHELGHALGLGHSTVAGGLMSEEYGRADVSAGVPAVHASDVELLRARCPEL